MLQLEELKTKWISENAEKSLLANDEEILIFQKNNNVILPNDLIIYFKKLNGTGDDCTDSLYEFYSLNRIQNFLDEFNDWKGIPNYTDAFNKFENIENIFVLANYSFNLFVYTIKLYPEKSINNEIFVISGGNYKKIANTFSDFIELYLNNSIELQLND